MTQWENLPEPAGQPAPAPAVASWSGFSADPRTADNRSLRASDADRDFATRLIQQARLEGRLDAGETDQRGLAVSQARTLGELAPLVSDLIATRTGPSGVPSQAVRNRFRRAGVAGWLGLAVLLNVVWLMTVLATGRLLYYWPMWPMLGTAIPMAMAVFGANSSPDGWHEERHAQRRAERDERRALRRADPRALPSSTPDPRDDDLR